MKCVNCNSEIDNNSKFCGFCGYKVNNSFNQNLNYNMNNMVNNQNFNSNLNSNNGFNNSMSNNNVIMNQNINTNNYNEFSNNINNEFKTWEGVVNLFRSVNGVGNQNIILIAHKNGNSASTSSMLFGGVIGGIADSMEKTAGAGFKIGLGEYDALILNFTECGIGFIPLNLQGKRLSKWTMDRMIPNMSNYVFVGNNSIEKIIVKNNSIIDKSKRIILKIQGNVTFDLIAYMNEKLVPYHSNSMNQLLSMYGK